MSNQTEVTSYLEKLTPNQVVEDKAVEMQFIKSFEAIHGTAGLAQYEKEKFYFQKLLSEKPELQECTRLSLYGAFLELASLGLSLDNTSKALCYIMSRNVKSGHKNEKGFDLYEKRAYLVVTGPGELVQRMRANQIKYADNPIIVYDGDTFEPGIDDNGKKYVHYKMAFHRKSQKVIAGFLKINRPDGSIDFHWMLEDDFERLAEYSARSNSYYEKQGDKNVRMKGKPNALYNSWHGGIDPGFLESKLIKHAFETYPKVKTGAFAMLESQVLDPVTTNETQNESFTPAIDVTHDDTSFAEPSKTEETPGIQFKNDDTF